MCHRRRAGYIKLFGKEGAETLSVANNYATCLMSLQHFEEAKLFIPNIVSAAQRVLGEDDIVTLTLRWFCADALYRADGATLGDLREAVEKLEDLTPTARRVLGGAHPNTMAIEVHLQRARAALRAREETQP